MDIFLNFTDQTIQQKYQDYDYKSRLRGILNLLTFINYFSLSFAVFYYYQGHQREVLLLSIAFVITLLMKNIIKRLKPKPIFLQILVNMMLLIIIIADYLDFIFSFNLEEADVYKFLIFKHLMRFLIYQIVNFYNNCQSSMCLFLGLYVIQLNIKLDSEQYAYQQIILSLFVYCIFCFNKYDQIKMSRNHFLLIYQKQKKDEVLILSTSHDLKTPITSMIQIIKEIKQKPELFPDKFPLVQAYAQKMLGLMYDMLDYQQSMTNNDIELNIHEFNLYDELDELKDYHGVFAEQKKVKFMVDCKFNHNLKVNTDLRKLTQIVDNILSNAIKFSKEDQGEIKVTVEYYSFASLLQFDIKDNGVGISSDIIDNIQEAFKTFNTNQMNSQGTGIGLYISKLFAQQLGPCESLIVKSQINNGATFTFFIHSDMKNIIHCREFTSINTNNYQQIIQLLKQKQQSEIVDIAQNNDQNDQDRDYLLDLAKTQTFNILIVDDDKYQLSIAKQFVSSLNNNFKINMLTATNGRDLLNIFEKNNNKINNLTPISLIITDVEMPQLDGIEASRQIKDLTKLNELYYPVQIVAYSGNESNQFKNQCKQVGIDKVLIKPAAKGLFIQVIETILLELVRNQLQNNYPDIV